MFLVGEDGMPRRISRYPQHPGWATLNRLETAGAVVIAIAVLVFLLNVVVSLRGPRPPARTRGRATRSSGRPRRRRRR